MNNREIRTRGKLWAYCIAYYGIGMSEDSGHPVIEEMGRWALDMIEKMGYSFAKIPTCFDEFMFISLKDMRSGKGEG